MCVLVFKGVKSLLFMQSIKQADTLFGRCRRLSAALNPEAGQTPSEFILNVTYNCNRGQEENEVDIHLVALIAYYP